MKTPKIREYMARDPIVLYVPGTRRDAMKIFVNKTISGIPVLREDDDKLVGIVTRADVFAKPNEDQLAMIMHKDPITCSCACTLDVAAKRMIDNNVHRLPILDENEKLVGMISPFDLLAFIEKMDLDRTVETVMRKDVVPLYGKMPANVALEVMNLTGAKALPVLNDEAKVGGILTDRDIYAQVRIDSKMVESELGPETEEDIHDAAPGPVCEPSGGKPSEESKTVGSLVPLGSGKRIVRVEAITCSRCIQKLLRNGAKNGTNSK